MNSENEYPNLPAVITVHDDAKKNADSVGARIELDVDLGRGGRKIPVRAWGPTEEEALSQLEDQLYKLSSEVMRAIQKGLHSIEKKDPVEADYAHRPID